MNTISGCKIARRPSHMAGMMLALGFAAGLAACADGGSSGGIGGSIPELTAISVAPGTAAIEPAEALQFTATGSYSDGSSKDLTTTVNWSSGNTSVATVDSNGLALGVADGTASITAIDLDSGLGDNATLTVETPTVLLSISLTPTAATIAEGNTQPFTAMGTYSGGNSVDLSTTVNWSSGNMAVATVNAAGLALGVADGTTSITAIDPDSGLGDSADLTVDTPVVLSSISLTPSAAAIAEGDTQQFAAMGAYSDGSSEDLTTTVNWSSGNTAVATVDAAGLALGVADGTASITAIDLASGLGDSAALAVDAPAVLLSISLTPPTATIADEATQQIAATGTFSDGSSSTLTAGITWDSSDTAVATVDTSGLASAVAVGEATLSATDDATGIQGTMTLTVVLRTTLDSISVTPASSLVTPGAMIQYTATGNYPDETSLVLTSGITWNSSNESVATVDAEGLASTLADGTTTISATDTASAISGSAVLTVSSYFTTTEVAVASATIVVQDFTVDIPVPSWGIGIVAQGVTTNFKVIDHGQWIITGGQFTEFITDPSGVHVPLSFALIDLNGDGTRDEYAGALFNHETASVFFPNDGSLTALPAGTYTFPVAAINAGFSGFETDTVQPYVFYKTGTETQTTMKLNIWVPSGVGGIMTAMDAQNDPEIQGAIAKIREIYETDADVALNLAINVDVVPDSSFAILDDVAEWWDLNAGYPTSPTHDAMNIFVVSAIAFQPLNVIGLAPDITGPFSRQGTIISGTLAEYQGDGDGTFLGVILAHEFGHYLGLYHTSQTNSTLDGIIGDDVIADTPNCTDLDITIGGLEGCPDAANYMFPIALGGLNQNEVSTQQGLLIRLNPAVTVP
ncbi:MAG: Ig-like domain-containing protein [SAR324 cluster bacterium]|nr:Ig-like domain-containing protein [SAR324 cluster bacterium]